MVLIKPEAGEGTQWATLLGGGPSGVGLRRPLALPALFSSAYLPGGGAHS